MASVSHIVYAPDLTEQVYQRLLNAICDGELAPAAQLTQEELAATLAAGRTAATGPRIGPRIDADCSVKSLPVTWD